jgi:hypothetical protein
VKSTGRDEPIGVVIHICMETTQGISLYSYLYLKLAKTPCFSYYLLWFFFYKIREQEGRTGSAWGRVGVGTIGGEDGRERCRRINMVQIIYTHVYECKNCIC